MIVGSEILEDGTLLISYYDENGKIKVLQKRLPQSELFNWVESKNATGFKNWDGKTPFNAKDMPLLYEGLDQASADEI